jgi:N-acetylglutamate synthase-like GNAT family acetyltransferase
MAFSDKKDTTCWVCGPDNPHGLHIDDTRDGESAARAEVRAADASATLVAEANAVLCRIATKKQAPKPDAEATVLREFQPGDEDDFRRLNEEWIVRHFRLEPKDDAVLADPRRAILDRGGRILLAIRDGRAIGCCALLAMSDGVFEVAKMAVTESARGGGVGRRLLERAIALARSAGARRLFLETNHILTPAIRLYESLGFQHLPPERVEPSAYSRSDVSMELDLVAREG